jgi:hypothetical protein
VDLRNLRTCFVRSLLVLSMVRDALAALPLYCLGPYVNDVAASHIDRGTRRCTRSMCGRCSAVRFQAKSARYFSYHRGFDYHTSRTAYHVSDRSDATSLTFLTPGHLQTLSLVVQHSTHESSLWGSRCSLYARYLRGDEACPRAQLHTRLKHGQPLLTCLVAEHSVDLKMSEFRACVDRLQLESRHPPRGTRAGSAYLGLLRTGGACWDRHSMRCALVSTTRHEWQLDKRMAEQ